MAHEIETMAYFGRLPWHGLGTALEEADLYDWQAASKKAGLDWSVDLVPLVTADTQAQVAHKAVRRSTDNKVLGVVGPRYAPLQNRDAFAWFQPFLDAKEAALHTAGSLRGGSRVWVLAKLRRDPMVIAQGDEVEKFILLSHGHDGSLAVRAGFTPIRVVCQNTLSMAHGEAASKLIRVRHTKDVLENLASIREVMDLANQEFEATAEQFRLLARKSINGADLRKYVRRVLKIDEEPAPSTRSLNTVEEIVRLAESGRGNDRVGRSHTVPATPSSPPDRVAASRRRHRTHLEAVGRTARYRLRPEGPDGSGREGAVRGRRGLLQAVAKGHARAGDCRICIA